MEFLKLLQYIFVFLLLNYDKLFYFQLIYKILY